MKKSYNIESRKFNECLHHLEKVTFEFGRAYSSGAHLEEIEIALLMVRSYAALMIATIAKVLEDKPKELLLDRLITEIKDQFFCFDEIEKKKIN